MRRRAKLATNRLPHTSVGTVATGVNARRAPSVGCGGTPNTEVESAVGSLGKHRIAGWGIEYRRIRRCRTKNPIWDALLTNRSSDPGLGFPDDGGSELGRPGVHSRYEPGEAETSSEWVSLLAVVGRDRTPAGH